MVLWRGVKDHFRIAPIRKDKWTLIHVESATRIDTGTKREMKDRHEEFVKIAEMGIPFVGDGPYFLDKIAV